MAKIVEPAIHSVWENGDGVRFWVIASIFVSDDNVQHQLQAMVTGRRYWVTGQSLPQKYTWISDPVDGDDDEEEAASE
jgi:hypothetical protein